MEEQPNITVGLCEKYHGIEGFFNGPFTVPDGGKITGSFHASAEGGSVVLVNEKRQEVLRSPKIICIPIEPSTFSLKAVTIGRSFHWERQESQTFEGALTFLADVDGTLTAINTLSVESYLSSVITSEMSGTAPLEFLKAQAVTSRSWLVAMLEKKKQANQRPTSSARTYFKEGEIIRWYDLEDHERFDVCADDHCQRYQGVARKGQAVEAVSGTCGTFLTWQGKVCDARFHKACGGLTEWFETAWADVQVPYLISISDASGTFEGVQSEEDARQWLLSRPDAYCRVEDQDFLGCVLPSYDQETADFFRWQVVYERGDLEKIIHDKSGIDFGTLHGLIPLVRGPSGRIHRLKIVGSRETVIVGKELEIRRWLSPSHLYSSAFVVQAMGGLAGIPEQFVLHGGGWGHGVGLCQIGAAAMAERGFSAEAILAHYFPGTLLERLYS
jgi:SpoIID/LytB domain protein